MKNIMILTILAIIILIAVVIICFKIQKGGSELENSNNENIDKQKKCTSCQQPIDSLATVCQHCNRRQSFLGKHLVDISIAASLLMVILATFQFIYARKKNIDASKALETAQQASKEANVALSQANVYAKEIKNLKYEGEKLKRIIEKTTKLSEEIIKTQNKSIQINEFMMTLIRVQNDDRLAYDQLSAMEKDNESPFQKIALIAKMNIRLNYGEKIGSMRGISTIAVGWKEGVDPSKLSITQLMSSHEQTEWHFRPGLTSYIWERNDFSKKERIKFLIDVIKNERNLKSVCLAQYFLSREAKIKFNPLIIDPLLEWWEENKGKYNNNPEDKTTDSTDKK